MLGWFASWRTLRARRPGGIDLAEADRLACGSGQGPQPSGLDLLLAAARAPAWADELAGEEEAVSRLVEARRVALSDSPGRSRDAQVPLARKTVAVKLAVALASVLVAGGVAAAETGNLPGPAQQRAHDLFSLLGVPAPDHGRQPGGNPSGGVDPTPTAPAPTPTPVPSPAPSGPSSPGGTDPAALCRAWSAAGRDPYGTGMDNQDWRTLAGQAGGRVRVPAFCGTLLEPSPTAGTAGSTPPASHSGGGPANPSRSPGGRKYGGS